MDSYNVRITKRALEQLNDYVAYIECTLLNPIAADNVTIDAEKTELELSRVAGSLKLCDHPALRDLGYRSIKFEKHDYVMLYRIDGRTVFVDGVYHSMQDYENTFANEKISILDSLVGIASTEENINVRDERLNQQ